MRRKPAVRLRGALLGVVALLLAGSSGAAEPPRPLPVVAGKVTHVNDGDSIEVELTSGRVRVRMSAIDTPEYDQPYGAKSSAALPSHHFRYSTLLAIDHFLHSWQTMCFCMLAHFDADPLTVHFVCNGSGSSGAKKRI